MCKTVIEIAHMRDKYTYTSEVQINGFYAVVMEEMYV